jgi:peptide/nickel transport system permease protein
MSFQIVVLSTDWLVYLLAAVIVATVVYVRGREHLRAPWRRVAQSRSGMVGLTVLLAFVIVGLLDSVHFRPRLATGDATAQTAYAVEVLSTLDVALDALRSKREKTYSAPLATQLYAKETIELPGGGQARDYPRLKYGGAALKDPEREWAGDVTRTALAGIGSGVAIWLASAILIAMFAVRSGEMTFGFAWARLWRGRSEEHTSELQSLS